LVTGKLRAGPARGLKTGLQVMGILFPLFNDKGFSDDDQDNWMELKQDIPAGGDCPG